MPPAYRFLDRWVVAAPIERVYDAIGDVLGYERWWTDFVLRATGPDSSCKPPHSRSPTEFAHRHAHATRSTYLLLLRRGG